MTLRADVIAKKMRKFKFHHKITTDRVSTSILFSREVPVKSAGLVKLQKILCMAKSICNIFQTFWKEGTGVDPRRISSEW